MRILTLLFLVLSTNAVTSAVAESRVYAVFGDAGEWNRESKTVERSLLSRGVKDLILVGDNVYPGLTYEAAWSPWIRDGFRFFLTALGNHHNGYENEMRFFGMPREYYSRELAPGVLGIVLNSDHVDTAEEQARFLERALARSDAQSIFVIYHHPSLSLTENHPWQERYEFQVRVRPILFRYRDRISAILNGHDHVAGAFSFDSMPVLLSGAVKEVLPFVPVNRVEEKIRVKTEWIFRPTPTWLRLSVTDFSEDSVAEYVDAATSRVMCSVRIRTGRWLYLEDDCYRGYRRRR